MTTLPDIPQGPHLPTWIRMPVPKAVHHAAFEAWLHTPTGSCLVKLWFDHGCCVAGCGSWRYEVRHPADGSRQARVAAAGGPMDEAAVLDSAEAVIGELVKSIGQAR